MTTYSSITDEDILLKITGALESNSEHPISLAILDMVKEKNILVEKISNFTTVSGRGVKGIIDENEYFCGNI